jgi:hypothetical protein
MFWFITNYKKIFFYRLPKNIIRREKWLLSIAPPDFVPSKWTAVCSEHFKEDSFVKNEKYTTLAKNAIPSVFKNSKANNELSNASNKHVQEENIDLCININAKHDHSYPLPSQRVLKRKLDTSQEKVQVLQKKVKLLKRSNSKLKKKVESLTDVIDTLKQKNFINEHISDILKETTSQIPAEMVSRLIKNTQSKKVSREKYSTEMRAFSVTLQFYSSKGYNFVRETFGLCLPHENVVRRWYSTLDAEPGFTEQSFQTLKKKVEEEQLKKKDVFVYITFDEMAIRKKITFDGKQFVGCVDYGKIYVRLGQYILGI